MNNKILKFLFLGLLLLPTVRIVAWDGMPMPALHVEGRYLRDTSGHIVNLHGFGQTYSPFFNEGGTKWNNYNVSGCLAYNKGIIDKILTAGWKVNFMRLHMDPYWSNTPGCTGRYEGEECFNETRFKKYLDEVFIPMAEYANSKGLYVVMRPPGVCPEKIEIGGVYHKYLIKVWGIVAKHPKLKNNPYIMFELANEPIDILGTDGTYGAGTQGHFDNLKSYFQTVTDTIRKTSDNILWIPGLGFQSLYAGYATNPIDGENIGYAVHVYPGWFNSGNGYEAFQKGWDNQVQPVADFAPVIVTEMDWAPARHNKSWGKDSTGVAGGKGFGANFRKITDECGNVSWMLFTSPDLLARYGNASAPSDIVDFLTDPEACPTPVYGWYQEYADAYSFTGVTEAYKTLSDLKLDVGENITMLTNSSTSIHLTAIFEDGHSEIVSSQVQVVSDNPEVVNVTRGRMFSYKDGYANVKLTYTDPKGGTHEFNLKITSTTFPLTEKLLNPDIWGDGTFTESTSTLKTGQWGFGGWQYNGIDLRGYKYIVARLSGTNTADVSFNVFDEPSYWSSAASTKFGSQREVVVRLKYTKKDNGTPLNPAHFYIIGFWSSGSNPFVIDTVFLSNSSQYDLPTLFTKDTKEAEITKLEGFSYIKGQGPSASKSFNVFGDMLKSDMKVQASTYFEISLSATDGYTQSITLTPENGIVNNTEIFVRLKADLVDKSYTSYVTASSTGAVSKKVSLTGLVEKSTGIEDVIGEEFHAISTEYYNLTGQRIIDTEHWQGVLIEKKHFTNGSIWVKKVIKLNNK